MGSELPERLTRLVRRQETNNIAQQIAEGRLAKSGAPLIFTLINFRGNSGYNLMRAYTERRIP